MPACNTLEQNKIIDRTKQLVSVYEDMAELIRLGAYRQGSDPSVDEAIHYFGAIEKFLSQTIDEATGLDQCYSGLAEILNMNQDQVDTEMETNRVADGVEQERHIDNTQLDGFEIKEEIKDMVPAEANNASVIAEEDN